MKTRRSAGHLAAFLTILIWGTTFISTKLLLKDFQPVEILFLRFAIGYFVLLAVSPKWLKTTGRKQEGFFALAGLCGICFYYLLENIALTFTMASNVGVIVSIAPFFTALLLPLFLKSEEKPHGRFFIGFALAMAGIVLISFNGSEPSLNPIGDLLAVLASLLWAFYSILTRKIGSFGYPVILATRRTFFYGLLFMLPFLPLLGFRPEFSRLAKPENLANLLYLGFLASALCFVTWNFAVKRLGAVRTSVYIYLVPIITVAASFLILGEPITWLSVLGTFFTLTGLFLSERHSSGKNS